MFHLSIPDYFMNSHTNFCSRRFTKMKFLAKKKGGNVEKST